MKVKFPLLALPLLTVFVCLLLNISPLRRAIAQTKPGAETLRRQLQRGEEIKALPGKNKRWALVIGVDDYSESQITKLSGAANDARTLAGALIKYAGFPEEQVILLASDQPSQLQPRRSTILRYLSNLRGTVPKDGLLLISFAGHGIERGGHAFLLPSDALGVNDMALLEDTAISVERIKESIRATGVGQVILILDACRSDPAPGRSGGDNLMTADFRTNFNFDLRNREIQAFATLYATAVGERAYEYDVKKQGYFTWALVEGLRGEAANEKGEVTLAGLLKYIQDAVPKLVHRDLGSDKQQTPFAIIEGYRAEGLVIAATERIATNVGSMPTVDQIIESDIRAIGGRTAVENLKTIVATGFYEITAGNKTLTGDLEEYIKLPDKELSIMYYGSTPKMEGFDGVVGWTSDSDGVKTMSEMHLGLVKRNLALSFLTDVKKFNQLYPRTLLRGKQEIGGQETYVVEATPDKGRPETLYFDTRTGLLLRWDFMDDSDVSQPGVLHPTQLYFENYAEIAEVMVPLTQRQVISGYVGAMRLGSVKFNVPIDDTKFRMPSIVAPVPASSKPQLTFTEQKDYQTNGQNWTRYYLSVTNRANYPNEMFAPAPNLPPCGLNKNSSRTWVDIRDQDEKRLIGFCAVMSSDGLGNLWFNLQQGQAPPSHVFIVLTDRQTNAKYKSALLAIPLPGTNDVPKLTNSSAKNRAMSVEVRAFAIELQSCKMSGGDVTCELQVTNKTGGDKEFALCQSDFRVTRRGKDTTKATDNMGSQYEPAESMIGSSRARKGNLLRVILPSQAPVKMELRFENIASASTTFTLLRIAIYEQGNGHPELIMYADFRNVVIEK